MLNESKAMNEGDIFNVIASVFFFSFIKCLFGYHSNEDRSRETRTMNHIFPRFNNYQVFAAFVSPIFFY